MHALSCLLIAFAADPAIFLPGEKLETLWNAGEFTEGVATAKDGTVLFSDIAIAGTNPGRIMKFDPATKQTTVHVADSGQSNGLFTAPDGRLLAVCGANQGRRALAEITADGQLRVLADRFEGKRFNAPNDLVVHPRGWVFFSDPHYVGKEPLELDHMSVYRYDPATKSVTRATTDITKPNGVIISPDGKTLYVAETDNGRTGADPDYAPSKPARFTLNAFPIRDDGTLGPKRVLHDFGQESGIDGMTVDTLGRIYAAVRIPSRFGIAVFTPDGREVAFLPTPELPTNCTFGRGAEAQTLYVTAGSGLYRIKVGGTGFHP
jgi:gluconolactonase